MKTLEIVAFDQMLLAVIREAYNGSPLMGGVGAFSIIMNKKGTECDNKQIKESLERLQKQDLISHKWNGKYFVTVPILQVPIIEKEYVQKKEPINATPLVYKFYDLFKDFYHDNNYVTMTRLSELIGVSPREIRKMKKLFNTRGYSLKNGNTFKRKILGNNNGYTLISNTKQKKEARYIIINKLLDAVEELQIFDEDMNLDDQLSFDTKTFKTKINKSISNDLDKKEN